MTQALDAAIRAANDEHYRTREPSRMEDIVHAALRAALPAEPTPEMLEVLEDAIWDSMCAVEIHERVQAPAAYRALRAHLLGEDVAIPIRTCPRTDKPCYDARCARDWCRREEHYP